MSYGAVVNDEVEQQYLFEGSDARDYLLNIKNNNDNYYNLVEMLNVLDRPVDWLSNKIKRVKNTPDKMMYFNRRETIDLLQFLNKLYDGQLTMTVALEDNAKTVAIASADAQRQRSSPDTITVKTVVENDANVVANNNQNQWKLDRLQGMVNKIIADNDKNNYKPTLEHLLVSLKQTPDNLTLYTEFLNVYKSYLAAYNSRINQVYNDIIDLASSSVVSEPTTADQQKQVNAVQNIDDDYYKPNDNTFNVVAAAAKTPEIAPAELPVDFEKPLPSKPIIASKPILDDVKQTPPPPPLSNAGMPPPPPPPPPPTPPPPLELIIDTSEKGDSLISTANPQLLRANLMEELRNKTAKLLSKATNAPEESIDQKLLKSKSSKLPEIIDPNDTRKMLLNEIHNPSVKLRKTQINQKKQEKTDSVGKANSSFFNVLNTRMKAVAGSSSEENSGISGASSWSEGENPADANDANLIALRDSLELKMFIMNDQVDSVEQKKLLKRIVKPSKQRLAYVERKLNQIQNKQTASNFNNPLINTEQLQKPLYLQDIELFKKSVLDLFNRKRYDVALEKLDEALQVDIQVPFIKELRDAIAKYVQLLETMNESNA
uniref:Pp78-81 n=1 Tax=Lymantria dispar multicapsid nuclear polyhedrosis virus TaxID=10449 RepID=A0A1B1MQL7_NPVLD|nr:pp78-81 [Lymantria dispar multiple nucleopolyhedrovirus]